MDIRQLSTFIAVAESGRASEAAIRCCLTQGAVSQQIHQLEDELGIRLFERTHKEMKLTDAGQVLLDHARTIINDVSEARTSIDAIKGKLFGELRIGAGSFIEPFIGPVISDFMLLYPNVRLCVQYDYPHVLNRMLRDHNLDIAFSINKSYAGEGITSVPAFRLALHAIMPQGHPLANRKHISFADIIKHRFMLPDIGIRELDTIQQYAVDDMRPMLSASCGDTNSMHSLITAVRHLGVITMLPPEYVLKQSDIIAKPVDSIAHKIVCHYHTMSHTPVKPAVSAFIECVKHSTILDIIT